jgi:hypothetical protein
MSTPNTPQYYLLPDGRDILDITLPMSNACGNALKYLKRAGLKPGEPMLKDLKKALDYLVREHNRHAYFNAGMTIEDCEELSKFIVGSSKDRGLSAINCINLIATVRAVLIADNAEYTETREMYLCSAVVWLQELVNSLEAQNE